MNADPRDPRAAVWLAVAQLCSADEKKTAVRYSPAFVDALSHVVYAQAETMGGDLECFAKHARRAKVTVDDVKVRSGWLRYMRGGAWC
ncbi:MHF histone-fold complex component [Coemansia javaensis]|uniref:MHF histone-fold complex component n=1 Tax=Coemansia javaensis TaxID=2761396 RepID=A0A9W8H914_9FUNG|nr:MHF histone-fold complex component [Coemansia javaensis]